MKDNKNIVSGVHEYEICICPRCGKSVCACAMTEGMCLKCAADRPVTHIKFGEHEFELPTEDVEMFRCAVLRMGAKEVKR